MVNEVGRRLFVLLLVVPTNENIESLWISYYVRPRIHFVDEVGLVLLNER